VKRLRHPISSIREPFGKAGLIVACLALVLATTGAAFAAGGLTKSQEKQVTKIAKKYAGKNGAPGATGPAGPAGAAGAKGDKGDPGEKGETGGTGNTGQPGKSVAVRAIPTEETECAELGGAMVTPEGGAGVEVCNGEAGAPGSPWPGGGVLASKATETGSWATGTSEGNISFAALPFPVQLPGPIAEANVHLLDGTTDTTHCPGTAAEPKAAPGQLCVYVTQKSGVTFMEIQDPAGEAAQNASRAGSMVYVEGGTEGFVYGTFAVTAP